MIEFLSIIVPYYCRPSYMNGLIGSIERHADMPYELIVNDDGSPDGSSDEIWTTYKDRVSTIAFNRGRNLGLAPSANRLMNLAHSEYILFLNSDCEIVAPCFQDLVNVIKKPYVGFIHPQDEFPVKEIAEADGTEFSLNRGIGGGCMMAFRRSVWNDVGHFVGFTGCADASFLFKIHAAGYFRANLVGKRARNVSQEELGSADSSAAFCNGFDVCSPKLFGLSQGDLDDLSRERLQYWHDEVERQQEIDGGWANMAYWDADEKAIMPVETQATGINWDAAQKHGKARWREAVQSERWRRHGH